MLALASLKALELSYNLLDLYTFARRMKKRSTERVLVVGAGLGGIQMSLELLRAGFLPTIFEQGKEFGGTWAKNGYPGCKSDVDATGFFLSSWVSVYRLCCCRGFSTRSTMRWYCNHLATTAGLLPLTCFQTCVKEITHEENSHYRVTYTGPDGLQKSDCFDYVVVAVGTLSQPSSGRLPMPELTSFRCRHSADMDEDFNRSCMGKKVALIGAGCSGTQMVSSLIYDFGASSVDVIAETGMYFIPGTVVDWPVKIVLDLLLTYLPFGLHFLRWCGRHVSTAASCEGTNNGRGLIAKLLRLYTPLCYKSIGCPDAAPSRPVNTSRMVADYDFFDALIFSRQARLVQARVTNWQESEQGVILSVKAGDAESLELYDKAVLATGFQTDWTQKLHKLGLTGSPADNYFGLTLKDHNTGRLFFMYGPNTNSTCQPITFLHEIQAKAILQMIRTGFVPSVEDYQASRKYVEDNAHPHFFLHSGWYMAGGSFSVNWPTTYAAYGRQLLSGKLFDK